MSRNYSNQSINIAETPEMTGKKHHKWQMILVLPAWVFISFVMAQAIVIGLVYLLSVLNISLKSLSESVVETLFAALMYVLMLAFAVGLPWIIKKKRVSQEEIGLTRLPTWTDILITPAGLIVYLIMSSILMLVATQLLSLLPWVDINQVQDVGFKHLNQRYEYMLAFTTLVVIAPIAEEVLFRGYLFGKLVKYVPVWAAILITSALFGAIHGQWDLAIDTFALSVILCLLRLSTGNIWASILLHMTKNGIAYYILFINPLILTTLGR